MKRSNQPHYTKPRLQRTLERRIKDVKKYQTEGNTTKAKIATSDCEGIKRRLERYT